MTVAVSMAKQLGATKLAVPTAGNAGGALAAYAARAGLEAHIFMPRDTPRANIIECRELGAHVVLIDGLITDCGAEIARRKAAEGWFDMSTLKGAVSGRGKEDARLRTGGATRTGCCPTSFFIPPAAAPVSSACGKLSTKWKRSAGLVPRARACSPCRPAAARRSCAPSKPASTTAAEFPNAHTCASGLRVPKAVGDFLMLKILRESKGGAVTVDDDEMIRVTREVGSTEGLFVAPEGAACFAALQKLLAAEKIAPESASSFLIPAPESSISIATSEGIRFLVAARPDIARTFACQTLRKSQKRKTRSTSGSR